MDGDSTHQSGRDRISRRTLLRQGAIAAAIGAVGGAGATGIAGATNVCPRPPAYWTTHWHDHFGERMAIPPAGELGKATIRDRLRAPLGVDTVDLMAKHYLGTYLNLYLRPPDDDACANDPVEVDGLGTVEWEHVKNAAQAWLRANGWDGTAHAGHLTWEPAVAVEGAADPVTGDVLAAALEAFNNGRFDRLDCDCEGVEPGPGDARTIDRCTTITDPGWYVLTDDIDASDAAVCLEIEADDVFVDGRGHTIDGGGTGRIGVQAGELLSIDVENVAVTNLEVTGFAVAGIAYEDATGGAIHDVAVTDSRYGIEYLTARDVSVTGSTISRNEFGVFATDGSGDDAFARNDIVSNAGHGAFVTEFSRGFSFHLNRIDDNGRSGIVLDDGSAEPEFVANRVRDNALNGISLSDLTDARVRRNRVAGNGADGIRLTDVDRSRLERNASRRNVDDGMELVDSDDNEIVGNLVRDNGDGSIVIIGASSGNTLEGNVTD